MKKKIKYIITTIVITVIGIISYVSLTPEGALQFAILREGYLIEPIRTQLSDMLDESMVKKIKHYTLANFSTEEHYDASCWTIFKSGIIYWGEASGGIKNS